MKQFYFLMLMLIGSFVAKGQYTLQDADVTIDNGIIRTVNLGGHTDVIIPGTLQSQVVIGVDSEVFKEQGLTALTLPSSIEVLASKAFYYNNLTTVTFEPNSQLRKIEDLVFASNSGLKGITLPTNANSGFSGYVDADGNKYAAGDQITKFYKTVTAQISYTLTDADVTISNGVITEYHYTGVSKDIVIPSTLNGQKVTGIAEGTNFAGVFSGNDLTSVSLPASVEIIGAYAFASNKLVEVNFAANSNLRAINDGAFRSNFSLQSITFPTHANAAFVCYKNSTGDVFNPGDTFTDFSDNYYASIPYTLTSDDVEVVDGYIQSCSYNFASKSIIIPSQLDNQVITGIADYSYSSKVFYNKDIVSITLPNTLEYVGSNALGNNALTVVELPASLKTIKSMAFYANDIATVSFATPSNIDLIEQNAFYSNIGIEITLPVHAKGENVYYLNNGTKYYSGNVVGNSSSDYVTTLDIPNGVNSTAKVSLQVLPNPTQGKLVITAEKASIIDVYSITGAKVKSIEVFVGQTVGSIAELPDGVYLLRSNEKVITKIIKN